MAIMVFIKLLTGYSIQDIQLLRAVNTKIKTAVLFCKFNNANLIIKINLRAAMGRVLTYIMVGLQNQIRTHNTCVHKLT